MCILPRGKLVHLTPFVSPNPGVAKMTLPLAARHGELQLRMSCLVTRLPLDAWQHIVGQLEPKDALLAFDSLWQAGIFTNIARLDAFWAVIASSRERDALRAHHQQREATFPDVQPYRSGRDRLVDMGVDNETATFVMAQSQGRWDLAMLMLGWI